MAFSERKPHLSVVELHGELRPGVRPGGVSIHADDGVDRRQHGRQAGVPKSIIIMRHSKINLLPNIKVSA